MPKPNLLNWFFSLFLYKLFKPRLSHLSSPIHSLFYLISSSYSIHPPKHLRFRCTDSLFYFSIRCPVLRTVHAHTNGLVRIVCCLLFSQKRILLSYKTHVSALSDRVSCLPQKHRSFVDNTCGYSNLSNTSALSPLNVMVRLDPFFSCCFPLNSYTIYFVLFIQIVSSYPLDTQIQSSS